jgi:hypothetical protein
MDVSNVPPGTIRRAPKMLMSWTIRTAKLCGGMYYCMGELEQWRAAAAKGMDRVDEYVFEARITEVIRLIAEIDPEHHRIVFFCSHFNQRGNYTAGIIVRFL